MKNVCAKKTPFEFVSIKMQQACNEYLMRQQIIYIYLLFHYTIILKRKINMTS